MIQFGPNSTTFLIAGEVYPSQVRATAHGVSAAVGKLGALFATVIYNYIGNRTKFWVVTWIPLLGAVLTYVFIPDTTGLDLREQERYWQKVREGRQEEYHGIAVHPRHLSLFERVVLKRHLRYDPKADAKAKVDELRSLWEKMEADVGKEGQGKGDGASLVSSKVSSYFAWEKQGSPRLDGKEKGKNE
ncbi:hypothetical protein MRB53_039648 [Persea americana]|nr:hypothetical protein MRB53_039648 [Persea americana]